MKSIINQLLDDLPEGLIVDAAWLENRQIASNLRSYYVKQGWLTQPTRGVYGRLRGRLSWQHVVISLQTLLQRCFTVGGPMALSLQGFSSCFSGSALPVHLYGPEPLPVWLNKLDLQNPFRYRNSEALFCNNPVSFDLFVLVGLFEFFEGRDLNQLQHSSLTVLPWGPWDWSLVVSKPERAYLELLNEVPTNIIGFEKADQVMRVAQHFNPELLQSLLHNCVNVKVKRLFFFFADRHGHAWRQHLNPDAFNLGKGKRMLVKGGHFDRCYQITVPRDFEKKAPVTVVDFEALESS